MPLIVFTGYPSSGKTTRAKELVEWISQRIYSYDYSGPIHTVKHITDDDLGYTKDIYADPAEEKKARGSMLSAVERTLSRNSIVVADSLNYIKGFRYQLYCVARSVGTPHCVIHCSLPQSKAREINEGRPDKYSEDVFNELVMRYEEPNSANRWDHPLFTVLQHLEGEKLPFEQIWGALVESRAPPPNLSTAVQPVTPTNFLHEMDQITKDIIDHVFSILQSGVQVSEVSVPRTSKKITRPITFQELKRYRAQFIKINRLHRLGLASIADLFVDYLNANIE